MNVCVLVVNAWVHTTRYHGFHVFQVLGTELNVQCARDFVFVYSVTYHLGKEALVSQYPTCLSGARCFPWICSAVYCLVRSCLKEIFSFLKHFFHLIHFFFLGHVNIVQKFLDQRSNLCHRSYSSDNTGSLTTWLPGNSFLIFFFPSILHIAKWH